MTTTTTTDIGGWASTIIKQDADSQNSSLRMNNLFLRLGRGFYGACNPTFSPEKKAAYVRACECLAAEIRRVSDLDSKRKALWELAYLSEAEKCGVDLDLIDEEAAFCGASNKLRVDPVFAAKVEEYVLTEGIK